jgi:uncharacterized protein
MTRKETSVTITYPSDIAFTPTVKAIQTRKGSRQIYARQEQAGSWETEIISELRSFIEAQTSFFLATANKGGQPYVQHRGGPAGFLQVLDPTTLAFADFEGNRQYISQGNLQENSKAHIFLLDHALRRRVKIWGRARVVADDPDLLAKLVPQGYPMRAEQVIVFKVSAWDENCAQHIPRRFNATDVAEALAARDARIDALQADVARLMSTR